MTQPDPNPNRGLEERIGLPVSWKSGDLGVSNRSELARKARDIAAGKFFELETDRDGWVKEWLRPLRVNPNGRVSGVEIALQDDLCGWKTVVSTGLPQRPFLDTTRSTYVRKVKSDDKNPRAKAIDRQERQVTDLETYRRELVNYLEAATLLEPSAVELADRLAITSGAEEVLAVGVEADRWAEARPTAAGLLGPQPVFGA